jgi:hypothetical protein
MWVQGNANGLSTGCSFILSNSDTGYWHKMRIGGDLTQVLTHVVRETDGDCCHALAFGGPLAR